MKKSELRKIIREELRTILAEAPKYAGGILFGKNLYKTRAGHRQRIERLKNRISKETDPKKKSKLRATLKSVEDSLANIT